MKVRVDSDLCQGHTICSMVAPAVFQLNDDDGHAYAIDGEVPAEHVADVQDAIRSCPERAIVEL